MKEIFTEMEKHHDLQKTSENRNHSETIHYVRSQRIPIVDQQLRNFMRWQAIEARSQYGIIKPYENQFVNYLRS